MKEYYAEKIKEIIKQAKEDNVVVACYKQNEDIGIAVFDKNTSDENMNDEIILISLIE